MFDYTKIKKRLRYPFLILTVLCMIIIFQFSSQTSIKSSTLTVYTFKFLCKIFEYFTHIDLYAKLSPKNLELCLLILRKCAHIFVFFCLSNFLMGFLFTFEISMPKRIICATLLSVLYALTDEYHQFFTLGRVCSFRDCLFDGFGVLLGICFALLIYCICYTIYHSAKLKKSPKANGFKHQKSKMIA